MGPISLTTTQSFAENWLMPRIAGFWATHPGLQVSVHVDPSVVDLRRSPHHLAIRYGQGDWPGLEVERLTDARSVIVGAPALARRLPPDLDATTGAGRTALADMPWLADAHYAEMFAWLDALGLETPALNVSGAWKGPASVPGRAAAGLGRRACRWHPMPEGQADHLPAAGWQVIRVVQPETRRRTISLLRPIRPGVRDPAAAGSLRHG